MLVPSILVLLGIGAGAAVILAVASQLLRVEENPLVEEVTEALPGANCGGCGFAGCEAYAVAVVTNEDIPANLCSVGGADTAAKVGEISGKAVVAGEPMMAFRRCSRVEGHVKPRYEYVGSSTCASAALLEGGPYMCTWACLGLGDCMRACPFDAMYIVNGMVEIIPSKCVSCGQCVKTCPRAIIQLIPRRARIMSHCATREKMKSVSDVCDVGCINCLKCLKACPADALSYENRRIEINHEVCLAYGPSCEEACVRACPRGIMRYHSPVQPWEPPAVDLSEPDAPVENPEPAEKPGPRVSPDAPCAAPPVVDGAPCEVLPVVAPTGKSPAPTLAETIAEEKKP